MSKKGKSKLVLVRNELHPDVEALVQWGKEFPGPRGLCRSPMNVAPNAMRVVLSYGFNVAVSTAAGEVDSYQFTGNGLFDPDVTGTGNQPVGFDQWSAFYTRNRVLASTIEFALTTPDATTTEGVQMDAVVFPSISSSLPTTLAASRSMPYAASKTVSGHFPNGARLKNSMETTLLSGFPRNAVLIDDNLSGSASANPANLWYWTIQTQPTDQAAATLIHMTGTVHYLVDFWDRNLITLSSASDKAKKRGSLTKK